MATQESFYFYKIQKVDEKMVLEEKTQNISLSS